MKINFINKLILGYGFFRISRYDPLYWLAFNGYLVLMDIEIKKKLIDIGFVIGFSWIGKWFFSRDLDILINVC